MSDVAAIARSIDQELAEIARSTIRKHLDLSDPTNQEFLREPDGLEQHQARWHQWGILTHTRVFLQHFDEDIPCYLQQWHLWDKVCSILDRQIDGVPRSALLRISILLHDIGKFAARTHSGPNFHFTKHERLSGQIVRSELDLGRYHLTPAQVEYIAMTAEDHFVLALIRKRAREVGEYDAAFVDSPSFADISRRIKSDHPDDFAEIGILFLGDSLAKAHPPAGPESALSQYDINIVVSRRYLEIVLEDIS